MKFADIAKRTLACFLALIMLFSFASCAPSAPDNGENSQEGENSGNEEEETPLYTEEELAKFAEYAVRNAERALVISQATIDMYVDSTYKRTSVVKLAESCSISRTGKKSATGTASVWHYTSFMAMASRMLAITEGSDQSYYAKLYPNIYSSIKYYEGKGSVTTYNGTSSVSMYAVNRASSEGGANISGVLAVYDDQMWIIREMIYVYNLTGQEKFLEEAVRLTDICLDGWDTTEDGKGNEIGGICWGPGYSTKHTCSNAPIIVALVDLYDIYTALGDSEKAAYYLEWAEKVYAFCIKYFMMSNGIYGDLVGSSRVEEGSGKNKHYVTTSQSTGLDQSAYTYNTGAMIAGGAALYRATGEQKYYTQTRKSVRNVTKFFANSNVVDGYDLWPTGRIWFDLILLEGVLEFYDSDPEDCIKVINSFQNWLDYGYDNYLDDGFLPNNFLKGWDTKNEKDTSKDVMDQTSCATIYAELSDFYARISSGN